MRLSFVLKAIPTELKLSLNSLMTMSMEAVMKTRSLALALAVSTDFGLTPAIADEHEHPDAGEKLGKVSFSSSCKPEVQQSLQRAVAMLHSFRYRETEKEFRDLLARDPVVCNRRLGHRRNPDGQSACRRRAAAGMGGAGATGD